MMNRFEFPFRKDVNRILAPSRDHAGNSSTAGLLVRRTKLVPSALIMQISRFVVPSGSQWNAIRVPSGDHAGEKSTVLLFVSLVGFVPSAFMTVERWPPSCS